MADNLNISGSEDLRGAVLDPGGLVDYQNGAIVSRTILDKPAGTVTVFAFDRGQALSEHTAPFDAMVQVLDGRAQITIEGKPFDVAAGQMVIMPADKPHAVTAAERFKMLLTMIRS
ncbi:MAG: cupin domain-containing protein [Candidatus Nealsonbacteria bacterium]|nr:cupin domain-containing protein [Candidatus Nealsonbacteria bacterium]